MLKRWPNVCGVRITFTINKFMRLHNYEFNEMLGKLVFTENPRSFEKYLTPPFESPKGISVIHPSP